MTQDKEERPLRERDGGGGGELMLLEEQVAKELQEKLEEEDAP